jgi:hypothetical protein
MMSLPLLLASTAVGVGVVCIGIYRAFNQGEFMLMILGMLILMSCAAQFIKRQSRDRDDRNRSEGETENQ